MNGSLSLSREGWGEGMIDAIHDDAKTDQNGQRFRPSPNLPQKPRESRA